MTAIQSPTPEHHFEADSLAGTPMAFIPLNEAGTLSRVEGPYHRQSIGHLAKTVLSLVELQSKNEALKEELLTDSLTGIANRLAFAGALEERIEALEKGEENPFALMFIDLDKFKQANDELGHDTGDELLKTVADNLQITLRASEGEMLARLGGDEFVAIVNTQNKANTRRDKEMSPEAIVEGLKDRLMGEVSAAGVAVGAPFVGASIGVAHYQPGESAEELLRRADQEMYRVKQAKGASR